MSEQRFPPPTGESPRENPPHAPEWEAMHACIRAMRLHHATVERRVGMLGIHHSQHRTLMHLARGEQIPSQRELAASLGISPAAVTATLKRLEREGYIERVMPDEDNRRNEIRITEAGRAKVEESRALFDEIDRATFAGFTEEELATLTDYLRRMKDNLTAYGESIT